MDTKELPARGSVLRRHWRLVLAIVVGIILFYLLLWTLLPFLFALLLAYLLAPVVTGLEVRLPPAGRWLEAKRIVSIVIVYLAGVGLVALAAVFMAGAIVDASSTLIGNASDYISRGMQSVREWAGSFKSVFPEGAQEQADKFLNDIGVAAVAAAEEAFFQGMSRIPATLSVLISFITTPIFLYYILKDQEKLSLSLYAVLPPRARAHARNFYLILERVLGRYLRSLLLLGLVVGSLDFIGLVILGIPYAPALGLFAGITEIIPIVGPWLGGAAGVIVTLATVPEKTVWVAILFLSVQVLENIFLVPKIQGAFLKIHPLGVLLILAVGSYLAGFWGLLLGVPLTATAIAIYRYVRSQLD